MSALRKRDAAAPGSGKSPLPSSCQFSKKYPCLFEFLTATEWPEGGSRTPGTITFFSEPGSFKACINDRDQALTAFKSGDTFTACLEALEAGLQNDTLDWKQPQKSFNKKRNSI